MHHHIMPCGLMTKLALRRCPGHAGTESEGGKRRRTRSETAYPPCLPGLERIEEKVSTQGFRPRPRWATPRLLLFLLIRKSLGPVWFLHNHRLIVVLDIRSRRPRVSAICKLAPILDTAITIPIMASESENQDWSPQRVENVLGGEATWDVGEAQITPGSESSQNTVNESAGNYASIVKDDTECDSPELQHTQTNSTEIGGEHDFRLHKTQTSKTALERRQFSPIQAGDAEELTRIATSMTGAGPLSRATTGSELQRRDTLAGISFGNPVLDPKSPEFDPYKWARM